MLRLSLYNTKIYSFPCRVIRYSMTEQQRQNWNKSYTHIQCRGRAVGGDRGFSELNPSPHASLFTSVSVESSPRSYLFTSVTGCTVSLRYRNRAEITVLMCKQKHIWFGFRAGGIAIRYCVNIAQALFPGKSSPGSYPEHRYFISK